MGPSCKNGKQTQPQMIAHGLFYSSLGKKLVTNSFGKRNFVQSLGSST